MAPHNVACPVPAEHWGILQLVGTELLRASQRTSCFLGAAWLCRAYTERACVTAGAEQTLQHDVAGWFCRRHSFISTGLASADCTGSILFPACSCACAAHALPHPCLHFTNVGTKADGLGLLQRGTTAGEFELLQEGFGHPAILWDKLEPHMWVTAPRSGKHPGPGQCPRHEYCSW